MYIVKPKNTKIHGNVSPVVENFPAKLLPKNIKHHSIINSRHKKEEIYQIPVKKPNHLALFVVKMSLNL